MKIMTGDAAVRASVPGTHILDTADGIILFPDAGTNGSTGAGTGDRSGAITCTRAVRYRPGYAGHLPEFWPADAAEACKMARSAKLYAGTYRTPVLLRLPAEIRNSRISVIPRKRTMTERRSADGLEKASDLAFRQRPGSPDLQDADAAVAVQDADHFPVRRAADDDPLPAVSVDGIPAAVGEGFFRDKRSAGSGRGRSG